MKTTSYYLLLGSLASSALAACGEDDGGEDGGGEECRHIVVVDSRQRSISLASACPEVSAIPSVPTGAFYGIASGRCSALCGDPRMNSCDLPDSYQRAFEAANGPAESAASDAGNLTCPVLAATELTLSCSRVEWRGRDHDGCPIAGRRPQGLVAVARREQQQGVADYLARSAHLEAASVLAFEALAEDLASLGAPAQLVADCLKAARQEVVHARVVRQLARARGAEPAQVKLRERALPSPLKLALENVAEGVVRESYGALQAIVSSRTAAAPDIRGAMANIAVDEAAHAALSTRVAAWLNTQLSATERLQVARAKHAAIAALRRELDHEPAPALHSELGVPSRAVALRLVGELTTHLWGDPPEQVTI
jgi:hypothetical protein